MRPRQTIEKATRHYPTDASLCKRQNTPPTLWKTDSRLRARVEDVSDDVDFLRPESDSEDRSSSRWRMRPNTSVPIRILVLRVSIALTQLHIDANHRSVNINAIVPNAPVRFTVTFGHVKVRYMHEIQTGRN